MAKDNLKRSDVVAYLRYMARNGPTMDMREELGVDEAAIKLAQGSLEAAAKQIEMGNPCLAAFNLNK